MPVVNAETGAVTYSLTSTQQSCGTGLSTAGLSPFPPSPASSRLHEC